MSNNTLKARIQHLHRTEEEWVIFEQENNQNETIDRGRFFQWGNNSNEDDGLTETERLIKKYANKK